MQRYTAQQKIEALKMLADGVSVNKIAKQLGCYPRTIYLWKSLYDGTTESLENKTPPKKDKSSIKHKKTAEEKLEILKAWDGETSTVSYYAKKYDCSEGSLWRWKRVYDGTLESLTNKSSKPYTPHPKSHTEEEIQQIERILSEYPNLGIKELYSKLLEYGYSRTEEGLYRFLQKNNYINAVRMKPNYEEIVVQIELLLLRIMSKGQTEQILKTIKKEIK